MLKVSKHISQDWYICCSMLSDSRSTKADTYTHNVVISKSTSLAAWQLTYSTTWNSEKPIVNFKITYYKCLWIFKNLYQFQRESLGTHQILNLLSVVGYDGLQVTTALYQWISKLPMCHPLSDILDDWNGRIRCRSTTGGESVAADIKFFTVLCLTVIKYIVVLVVALLLRTL